MDMRLDLIKNAEYALVGKLSEDDFNKVINEFTKILDKYEVTKRTTELTVYDDRNQRLINSFAATLQLERKSKKTIAQYIRAIKKFADQSEHSLEKTTVLDLKIFFAGELSRVSPTSANNTKMYVSAFFRWMEAEEIIEKNPMKKINNIKTQDAVVLPFTSAEVSRMRDTTTGARDRALLEFLLASGVRAEELCNMLKTDVNLESMEVIVRHGKGDKARTTFINPVCKMYLRSYLDSRNDDSEYLFVSLKAPHEPITTNALRRILKRVEAKSCVTDIHPHRFRHTFASDLYRNGMAVADIQKLLGHSSIATTMIYVEVNEDKVKHSYFAHVS